MLIYHNDQVYFIWFSCSLRFICFNAFHNWHWSPKGSWTKRHQLPPSILFPRSIASSELFVCFSEQEICDSVLSCDLIRWTKWLSCSPFIISHLVLCIKLCACLCRTCPLAKMFWNNMGHMKVIHGENRLKNVLLPTSESGLRSEPPLHSWPDAA